MATRSLAPLVKCLRRAAEGGGSTVTDAQLLARFVADRDGDAFTALIRRHGPLVLSVSRRVLGNTPDAEDVFQATFLVLARKAGSLARPEALGPWLHGVACRTAAQARAEACRRRVVEARAVPALTIDPDEGPVWRDLRPVLDEEIGRLASRPRAAVVLCYLEGRTNAEAARVLGCSRGTVATLLARARATLRRRLTQRGVTPAVLMTTLLSGSSQAACVLATLECSTVAAARDFATGNLAGAAPDTVRAAALAEGVAKTILLKKLKVAVAVLLTVGLAAGLSLATFPVAGQEPPPQAAAQPNRVRPDGPPPAPPVQPEEAEARIPNFAVTAPSPEIAERVRLAAERCRREQARLWLGRALPDWSTPCPLRVTIALNGSGGATTFAFDEGRVSFREMHLEGTLEVLLADSLPHEVTHTVLADWAGRPLPRWADEGAATLAESEASRRRQLAMTGEMADAGRLLPLRRLLQLQAYPRDVTAFYAQSHSLVDFLVRAGGRPKFLAFVAGGQQDGWDAAAETHYRYASVDELERAWLARVRATRSKEARGSEEKSRREGPQATETGAGWDSVLARPVVAVEGVQGRLPVGPAPTQGLATLGRDGRLTIRRVVTAYLPVSDTRGTRYEPVPVVSQEVCAPAEVRAFDAGGEVINARRLRELLKEETLVLTSVDGRPVDRLHLRLVKAGTLVLVLPVRAVPAGPPESSAPPMSATPLPVVPALIPPARPVQQSKE